MTIEIGILFAAIGCLLALLGYIGANNRKHKDDGAMTASFQTELKKDIEYIKKDISDIKVSIENNNRESKDSIRRVHARLDEHEATYHRGKRQSDE